MSKWSIEEVELLKEKYLLLSKEELEDLFYLRNYDAIRKKANELGLKKINGNYFTKEEEQYLIDNYNIMSAQEIAKVLGRSVESIYTKSDRLGMEKSSKWTNEEINVLIENYSKYSNKYINDNLLKSRTPQTIGDKARQLGLHKSSDFSYKQYDKGELIKLLQGYALKIGHTPMVSELLHNEEMPSCTTFSRYFGSYEQACLEANLQLNSCLFGDYTTKSISKNGDICFSKSELIITNFFIDNNINFKKEMLYSDILQKDYGYKRCDWYLIDYEIIVEFFGLLGKDYYLSKVKEKRRICNENNITLIELSDRYINEKN